MEINSTRHGGESFRHGSAETAEFSGERLCFAIRSNACCD